MTPQMHPRPLSVDARVGEWLDDPVGGPILRRMLSKEAGEARGLDLVRDLTLRRLVAVGGGILAPDAVVALLQTTTGAVITEADLSGPPSKADVHADIIARSPRLASVEFADLDLDGPHGPVSTRLYVSVSDARAAFVWVHGGGFVTGDLGMAEAHWVSLELAARGIRVLSVDYRKAVDGIAYPVPSDDVLAAWLWGAARLSGARRLSVHLGGASAGAALAAGVAVRLRDGAGPLPASLTLAYPIVHPTLPPPADGREDWYVGFTPEDVAKMSLRFAGDTATLKNPAAFAGLASLAGFPATFIVNSERDALRASGELFAEQLRASGVETRVELEPGVLHGHLSHPASKAASASLDRIERWLLGCPKP